MTVNRLKTVITGMLLVWLMTGAAGHALAADPNAQGSASPAGPLTRSDQGFMIDFKDVDLSLFVKLVGDAIQKNIVMDERVTGKVTIFAPKKLNRTELYDIFLSVIESRGLTVVPRGRILQVMPVRDARQSGVDVVTAGEEKRLEGLVTQIIPLERLNAAETVKVLTPLVSSGGVLTAYPLTNLLILTDGANNVSRLEKLVHELEGLPPRELGKIHVIPLENADAEEMARFLQDIFTSKTPVAGQQTGSLASVGTAAGPVNITAGKAANALLVTALLEDFEKINGLVKELSKLPAREVSRIHVVPLENADADELARVLQGLLSRGQTTGAAAPATSGQQAAQAAGIGAALKGQVQVTSDKATNSLLVAAIPEDFQKVRSVIKDLDIRRRQVYVEAAIMEVSLSRIKELGIEFRAMQNPANGSLTGFGGTSFGGISRAVTGPADLANLTGLAAGVIKGTITFRGLEFLNIGALIRALQSESGVNLLSTPQLMTTDNQKAEIVVGSNIPLVTGRSLTTGGNPLTTVERKDIGVTLRLTPHITEGEYVKLDLYQEISSLADPTSTTQFSLDSAGPIINKRYASTTVVVKDKETVAIGGLIREDTKAVEDKVPFFGDIPILGNLFKYKKDTKEKINLLVFLTPTIIKDDETIKKITEQKKGQAIPGKGETPSVP